MKTAVSTQVLIQGLVRSPDREGALAHLDPDRGFAFVGRGSMSFSDVIDPTIWVREKLSLALAGGPDSSEPQLRRAIAALRAVHAELMARPEGERTWISVLVMLVHDVEGMALTAGDCPCYRFRGGVLSRLGRAVPERPSGPPDGALGSESQVRLEMVPLHPQPGDCYILATHPLREGELSLLARDLASARDVTAMLRTACGGSHESGRVAIAALPSGHPLPVLEPLEEEPGEIAPLELDPIEPAPVDRSLREAAPVAEESRVTGPSEEPARTVEVAETAEAPETSEVPEPPERDVRLPPPSGGGFVERRPWY